MPYFLVKKLLYYAKKPKKLSHKSKKSFCYRKPSFKVKIVDSLPFPRSRYFRSCLSQLRFLPTTSLFYPSSVYTCRRLQKLIEMFPENEKVVEMLKSLTVKYVLCQKVWKLTGMLSSEPSESSSSSNVLRIFLITDRFDALKHRNIISNKINTKYYIL